jgi:4-amino-4-deoxy-L-arabinose transferase-like glycosyltransferase
MKKTLAILFVIWLLFVLRGIFYSAVLPVWEGYDEPFHFAYLQQLDTTKKIPRPDAPISHELQQSLHLLPLPWILAQSQLPAPLFSHDQYWKLPPAERAQLQQTLETMPQSWAREEGHEKVANYEAKQMPLYYLLFTPLFHATAGLALPSQVFLVRVFGILLASSVIPLGYLVARSVLQDTRLAISIVVLIVALPEFLINLARVGNESLALVAFTLMFYAAVNIVERPGNLKHLYLLAVSLGIGLLTKGYFLTAIPVFFLIAFWNWWRCSPEKKRMLFHTILAIAIFLLISGPWYWRVHSQTGSWSGESYEIALRSMSKLQLLAQARHVNWISGAVSILLSHIWFGAWSFLKFGRPVYLLFGLIILAALVGMCRIVFAWWNSRPAPQLAPCDRDKCGVLLLFYLFFLAGLAYDTLIIYAASGVSASNGWYMYSLIVAEAILLYVGLAGAFPTRFRPLILPALITLFVLLDVAGLHLLLLPYYTGMISHVSPDRIARASIGQLFQTGVFEFALRLSANKSAFLQPHVLIGMWVLFLIATCSLIPIAFRLRTAHDRAAG